MSGNRIIFMGTPEFACPTLQILIDRGEQLLAVVTQPDRPKGRGQKVVPPPVKQLAEKYGIPVYQPQKVRDPEFVSMVRELAPDVIVVVAFGQILPKGLLDIPRFGCVNVHASLLPRYRGAAPLNWCLINGETETGVTTMMMDVGLDTGDMLLARKTPIDDSEDINSLHDRMSLMGSQLLGETLDLLIVRGIEPQPQNSAETSYAPMLKKEDGVIDWQRDARSIHNMVRGLAAWPVAFTILNGEPLRIYRTEVGDGTGTPGTVLRADRDSFEVACLGGSLLLLELQLAGKKRLDRASFLSGCRVPVGTQLGDNSDGGKSGP